MARITASIHAQIPVSLHHGKRSCLDRCHVRGGRQRLPREQSRATGVWATGWILRYSRGEEATALLETPRQAERSEGMPAGRITPAVAMRT